MKTIMINLFQIASKYFLWYFFYFGVNIFYYIISNIRCCDCGGSGASLFFFSFLPKSEILILDSPIEIWVHVNDLGDETENWYEN